MQNQLQNRLNRLRQAQNDPQEMALIALEFSSESQQEEEREVVWKAIQASAVVHWFNFDILARLLDTPINNARDIIKKLLMLPMVEPFKAYGESNYNIHETTRLALRKRLFRENPELLSKFSKRAIEEIGNQSEPHFVIERLYHLFIASPDLATEECEKLYRRLTDSAPLKTKQILLNVLQELEATGMVGGQARAEVVLDIGWIRFEQGESIEIDLLANTALSISRETCHVSAIARSLCLW